MKFHFASNNGVVAVISEEHAKLYGTVKASGDDPIAAGCRVFTFCRKERMEEDASERMVFTGTHEDLEQLIKAGNHQIIRGMGYSGWDGYVPFSNGIQYGHVLGGDPENLTPSQAAEIRYVTTLGDVLNVFCINADFFKSAFEAESEVTL